MKLKSTTTVRVILILLCVFICTTGTIVSATSSVSSSSREIHQPDIKSHIKNLLQEYYKEKVSDEKTKDEHRQFLTAYNTPVSRLKLKEICKPNNEEEAIPWVLQKHHIQRYIRVSEQGIQLYNGVGDDENDESFITLRDTTMLGIIISCLDRLPDSHSLNQDLTMYQDLAKITEGNEDERKLLQAMLDESPEGFDQLTLAITQLWIQAPSVLTNKLMMKKQKEIHDMITELGAKKSAPEESRLEFIRRAYILLPLAEKLNVTRSEQIRRVVKGKEDAEIKRARERKRQREEEDKRIAEIASSTEAVLAPLRKSHQILLEEQKALLSAAETEYHAAEVVFKRLTDELNHTIGPRLEEERTLSAKTLSEELPPWLENARKELLEQHVQKQQQLVQELAHEIADLKLNHEGDLAYHRYLHAEKLRTLERESEDRMNQARYEAEEREQQRSEQQSAQERQRKAKKAKTKDFDDLPEYLKKALEKFIDDAQPSADDASNFYTQLREIVGDLNTIVTNARLENVSQRHKLFYFYKIKCYRQRIKEALLKATVPHLPSYLQLQRADWCSEIRRVATSLEESSSGSQHIFLKKLLHLNNHYSYSQIPGKDQDDVADLLIETLSHEIATAYASVEPQAVSSKKIIQGSALLIGAACLYRNRTKIMTYLPFLKAKVKVTA